MAREGDVGDARRREAGERGTQEYRVKEKEMKGRNKGTGYRRAVEREGWEAMRRGGRGKFKKGKKGENRRRNVRG